MDYTFTDPIAAKKNLNKQGTKILHYIASAYDKGYLDDPQTQAIFCSLLACVCEGKVTGFLDEETMEVVWSLTPEYQKKLNNLMEQAKFDDNVIIGPWGQYENR